MYRAFKYTGSEQLLEESVEHGRSVMAQLDQRVEIAFDAFLEEGEINASFLRDEWFPQIPADVFISHSHANKDLALGLAGWLSQNFSLKSFIDSCAWGHANDLLRKLDDRYCKNEIGNTYSYERRNGTTSHVHMMLSTAISRMMDQCECVIFVSTPQSVSTSKDLDSTVSSPWIFYELSQIEVLRKWKPDRAVWKIASEGVKNFSRASEFPKFLYEVNFDSLANISSTHLVLWKSICRLEKWQDNHPLDNLYEMIPYE